jgi:uncharacterized protein (DUF2252 family)
MHFAAVPDMHTPEKWNQRACDTCDAYELANAQLRADLLRDLSIAECEETPKTDAITDEIKRNNWRDWYNLQKMEEHAKQLERSENKLKRRIRQLIKHRGHVAAEAVMDKMAEEISLPNSIRSGSEISMVDIQKRDSS